jgi:hypothetical protein
VVLFSCEESPSIQSYSFLIKDGEDVLISPAHVFLVPFLSLLYDIAMNVCYLIL